MIRGQWAESMVNNIFITLTDDQKRECFKVADEITRLRNLNSANGRGWTRQKGLLHEARLPSAFMMHPEMTKLLYHNGLDEQMRDQAKEDILAVIPKFRAR